MFNSSEENKQAELFNDLANVSKKQKKGKFTLGKVALALSYENLIVFTIGLIMLLIVCYSLGVERGKYFARLNSESVVEAVKQKQQKQVQETPKEKPPEPQNKKIKIKLASEYTIQVATFRKAASVKEEVEQLKNRGYYPFIVSRGKFSEICVGNYKNKKSAYGDLLKLRKFYTDCYVRQFVI